MQKVLVVSFHAVKEHAISLLANSRESLVSKHLSNQAGLNVVVEPPFGNDQLC